MEKNLKKQIDNQNHFAIHLKLAQYFKSTILQFLKKKSDVCNLLHRMQ